MTQPSANPLSVDESLKASLCLSLVSGVGPRIHQDLLECFGSPETVLSASVSQLRGVPGVGVKLSNKIASARQEIDVDEELQLCHEHQISILTPESESYPSMLKEIVDPPGVLFVRGEFLPQDSVSIAIVGSRHATQYGLQQAERLASGLSRAGVTIVSGMARGIDGAAHRGALATGGRTLAVLGSGLLNLYPPEHTNLAADIASCGALISEAPPRRAPMSGAFPQRNRVITGMSLGVIVVEASERSGALISARHAMEQNREVFAVPGRVDSRMSRGCHRLLRDGAKLVQSIDDVLEELGPLAESTTDATGNEIRHPAELQLNDQEKSVLGAIGSEPSTIDEVTTQCGLPVHRVLSTISVLEMRRLIRRVDGNRIQRF